jgi:uncharacterized surface protein with fasciclin (FAS1) repeats
MKQFIFFFFGLAVLAACNSGADNKTTSSSGTSFDTHSQSGIQDSLSKPNVVQIAIGSKEHSTLVEAVKAADLVTSLSNAGPFTVFAPTNAAFEKLPKGTVEDLLKPEKKDALTDILQYHVYVGVLKADQLMDGQSLGMVNGDNIKITMVDGKPVINGKAHILVSIPASNGIVHIIDEVLLPPAK